MSYKDYKDIPRLQLIVDILAEKEKASKAFVQYTNKSHTYGKDNLYMREAHFITTVGIGDGMIMSEIAEKMNVTHGAVSQTALRLEKKGYIIRLRDPENYRQVIAKLTEKGEEFYREHMSYDTKEYTYLDQNCLAKFSDEDLLKIMEYEKAMYAFFTKASEQN